MIERITNQETEVKVLSWSKKQKAGMFLAGMAVCIGLSVCSVLLQDRAEQKRQFLQSQVDALTNELTVQVGANQAASEAVVYELTGLDRTRVQNDNRNAEIFFRKIMNWDDYESYCEARDYCINEYGISEDSRFLEMFLPKVIETPPTADGSVYNRIDFEGLNVSFEEMHASVVSVSDEAYSYLTRVVWSTRDKYGNEGMSTAVFTYEVSADNNLQNLDGYTLSQ